MTRVLALGDFHGKLPKGIKPYIEEKNIDYIVSVGDHGNYSPLRKVIFNNWDEFKDKFEDKKFQTFRDIMGDHEFTSAYKDFASSMKSVLNKLGRLDIPVYLVHGNTDFTREEKKYSGIKSRTFEEICRDFRNLNPLEGEAYNLGKFKIGGVGGYRGSSVKKGEGPEKVIDKVNRRFKSQLENLMQEFGDNNILVSHDVPYDCKLDKVDNPASPKHGEHIGDEILRQFIKKSNIAINFCGHMHEYHGMCRLNSSKIVVCGPAYEDKGVLSDLSEESIDFIEF